MEIIQFIGKIQEIDISQGKMNKLSKNITTTTKGLAIIHSPSCKSVVIFVDQCRKF